MPVSPYVNMLISRPAIKAKGRAAVSVVSKRGKRFSLSSYKHEVNAKNVLISQIMEGLQVKEMSEKSNVCCHKCRDQFQEAAELRNYQENAHNFYRCKSCGLEETSVTEFEFHLQTHGGFKLFKCFTCQEMFSFLHELNNHLASHLAEQESPAREEECLETQIELEEEMKTEPEEEYFEHSSRESEIEDQNAEEEPLEIEEPEKAAKKQDLSIGKSVFSVKKRKMHKCTQCPYSCDCISQLKRHLQTHSNAHPFKCTLCEKTYGYKSSLHHHMQTHCKEKNHNPCPECGKVFSTPKYMKLHLKTHNPERMFACDWNFCKYRTHNSSHLKRHRRTHTGENPFKCEFCNSKFNTKDEMKRHISYIHEPRTIPCTRCKKNFATSLDLKQHVQRKHKKKTIPCPMCDKKFGVQGDLTKHIKHCQITV
ncbi:zinc finger protein 37 homolog [Phlebotomus argentipes]|uniref:zinc finger protein 37 homolog n=1 Tax=Phlebotomus argentipes TaxID=94469 RepID=UPI0028931E07|nr:zinc finger protein 37 homolog [Phlebotomus argentipes]